MGSRYNSFRILLLGLIFLLMAVPHSFAKNGKAEPLHLSPELKEKIKKNKNKDEKIPVIIVFKTEPVRPHEFREQGSRRDIELQMKKQSEESQAGVLSFLREKEKKGRVEKIQSFWLNNSISVKAAPDVILDLGKRTDLKEVILDKAVSLHSGAPAPQGKTLSEIYREKAKKSP